MEKLVRLLLVVLGCFSQLRVDPEDHRYEVGDHVPFYVNKVGPHENPRETYSYFDLPFCQPDYFKDKKQTLGEILNGDYLIKAPYELEFRIDKKNKVACRKNLTMEEVSEFRKAIQRSYIFQMFYDDLSVWAPIGMLNNEMNRYALFKHIRFIISFNKDRVVEINVQKYPLSFVEINEDKETSVEFLYSVSWEEVDEPFEKRMEKYSPVYGWKNQWIPIMGSFVTLLLLISVLVKVYIRDFKKDVTEGLHNEQSTSNQEERGWKYIRDDVFAYPEQKSLLAAALGSGAQLLTLTIVILILGLFGMFYPHDRGRLLTAFVTTYAFTSIVAGYTSTSFYCSLEGTNWFGNLLLTGCVYCGPLFLTFCLLNTIATSYKASMASSFGTVMELFLILTLFVFLMLLLGSICGKRTKEESQTINRSSKPELRVPLYVAKLTREIQLHRWDLRTLLQMAVPGFFPFCSLNAQLPYMMNGIWGFGVFNRYTVSSMALIFALLEMSVTSAVFTAQQLAREDPNWWWRSFLRGGSVGLYVYGYCLYYYFIESDWSGSLQVSFFFGYMACVCYAISLVFGSVSFAASFLFVRLIYRSVKSD